MSISEIVEAMKQERDRLDAAIAALAGDGVANGRRVGRRKGIKTPKSTRRRRRLSAAAKKRISEAAKARWARAKRAGKNSL